MIQEMQTWSCDHWQNVARRTDVLAQSGVFWPAHWSVFPSVRVSVHRAAFYKDHASAADQHLKAMNQGLSHVTHGFLPGGT
jgi:hypothetical protein